MRQPRLGGRPAGRRHRLVCEGCGHRILMDRLDVERRFTGYLDRGPTRGEPEPMAHIELPAGRRRQDF